MSTYRRILVVTPTLGESPFLDATVKSVAMQPFDLVHVLSAPPEKLQKLRSRYRNVCVVPDAGKQGGVYGAINTALQAENGDWDWFTYINDDDALLRDFGQAFYSHLQTGRTESVIYGNVMMVDEAGGNISPITVERDPRWIPALLQQGISPLMQQGMLFRREIVERLGGFDTRYRLCADLDFWLRAYVSGFRFRYYPVSVAQFRLRNGQLSGSVAITRREQDEIVQRHLPSPISYARKQIARWRYRTCNLPRYLQRVGKRGFRTSYQLLEKNARQP